MKFITNQERVLHCILFQGCIEPTIRLMLVLILAHVGGITDNYKFETLAMFPNSLENDTTILYSKQIVFGRDIQLSFSLLFLISKFVLFPPEE